MEQKTMDALVTLLVYVTPFLAIGLGIAWWTRRKSVELSDVQKEAGPNRGRRGFSCWASGARRTEAVD